MSTRRSVLSAGTIGSLFALLLSRLFLFETPRFTAHVVHADLRAIENLSKESNINYTEIAKLRFDDIEAATSFTNINNTTKGDSNLKKQLNNSSGVTDYSIRPGMGNELSFYDFWCKFYYPIILCSLNLFVINVVFVGLLILLEPVAMYIGYNKGNTWQSASDECYGLNLTYLAIGLSTLLPGYYISAMSIDILHRKLLQFLGYLFMILWCSVCAGTHDILLNPNNDDVTNGLKNEWKNNINGWLVMYSFIFVSASIGPLSTTFTIPSELFPSSWRGTGYCICNIFGSLGSISGVWVFTYSIQPPTKAISYFYPCDRITEPIVLYSFYSGACIMRSNCPPGRRITSGDTFRAICSECISSSKTGCYPFGLGVQGRLINYSLI